eukprot:m.847493 g.847493  ORF g.847493 m.847493 type:complete len:98 (-) comp23484_c0_seq12:2305-2598(-)
MSHVLRGDLLGCMLKDPCWLTNVPVNTKRFGPSGCRLGMMCERVNVDVDRMTLASTTSNYRECGQHDACFGNQKQVFAWQHLHRASCANSRRLGTGC